MSCIPLSPITNSLKCAMSPKKAKKDEFPPFMNGVLTSTSTFECGEFNHDSAFDETSLTRSDSSMAEESILASSRQNGTRDFPLSAPSTLLKNKVLACSTPKEEDEEEKKEEMVAQSTHHDHINEAAFWSANIRHDSNYHANFARERQIRNMARLRKIYKNNGDIIAQNSYFYKGYPAYLEEKRKQEQAEKEQKRKEHLDTLKHNLEEFLMSIVLTIWQIAFMLDLTSTINGGYTLNFALLFVYAWFFMVPLPIWYLIIGGSFLVYWGVIWMLGFTLNFSFFAFSAIFIKCVASIIQGIYLAFY